MTAGTPTASATQVDDRGQQHELEVPRDGLALLLGQDGPAGGALPLLAEVLVLHQRVALLAPGHYLPPIRTRSFIGVAPNSNFSRSPRSM
jgi:hypothetical protein